MNTISIHGNIVRDIEIGSKSETSYAKFTIASDRSTKGDSATDFFRVVTFDTATIAVAQQLAKGDFIKVIGSVRLGTYDGEQIVDVLAKSVEPRGAPF